MNIKNLLIALVATFGLSVSIVQADSPKYSIDSSNASEYADMLSPGQMAMFSAYPDTYRMDVYDSSGECVIPADITAISQSNGAMINDNEGFEVFAKSSYSLGFDGKIVVHPNQINIANKIFSPSKKDLLEAQEMLRVIEQSSQKGK